MADEPEVPKSWEKKKEVKEVEERKQAVSISFDNDLYRELFNGYVKDPQKLAISADKPVGEMSGEEITDWFYKLEEFVRYARVAKQVTRITIEDRLLQATDDQKKKQRELDRLYKPVEQVKVKAPGKSAKSSSKKLTDEEKKIKAAMDLLGMNEEKAIEWLKSKGRL